MATTRVEAARLRFCIVTVQLINTQACMCCAGALTSTHSHYSGIVLCRSHKLLASRSSGCCCHCLVDNQWDWIEYSYGRRRRCGRARSSSSGACCRCCGACGCCIEKQVSCLFWPKRCTACMVWLACMRRMQLKTPFFVWLPCVFYLLK